MPGGQDTIGREEFLQAAALCRDLANRGVAKAKALAQVRAVLHELPPECR